MSRSGESFERVMAYILASAGFVVKEQPHNVVMGGEMVGDLDVLAVDPKSSTMIAVTCKEWVDQTPHAKDFNHFLSLLGYEDIKYGIVAWTNVPSSVYPLVKNAEKRGYHICVVDQGRYEELHSHMLSGQRDKIEDYFRRALGLLATSAPTVGQEMIARRSTILKKSVKCSNLLPLQWNPDAPSYIRNAYFKPVEVKLSVRPYLLAIFHAHKEFRKPRTGELLCEISRDVDMVCDGLTGRSLSPNDHVYQVVRNHYSNAYKHHIIEEEDFTVEAIEPKIDRNNMSYKMRVDAARSIQPAIAEWTDSREEEHEARVEVSPNDLKEFFSDFISVPVWHISYRLGNHTYVREFYATDGFTLRDDMRLCARCGRQPTIAVCKTCGATVCSQHTLQCKVCGEFFCDSDSQRCRKCLTSYCKPHSSGAFCITCGAFTDTTCVVRCKVCNGAICPDHIATCDECKAAICPNHTKEKRYALRKKRFCGESCHDKYDSEFRGKGTFGKLRPK